MCDALVWSLDAIRWPETISALAAVATAIIALCALQTWRHQDKAKVKAEFLDALIDAAHTYIAEMREPITLLEMVKIGMPCHAPTLANGEPEDIAVKGAIAYIQKNGDRDRKLLLEMLKTVQPSVEKLRSLAAKGQVFKFDDYAKCQMAVDRLTQHFDRIVALMDVIGSPTWNWEHPEVLRLLKNIMAIDPKEIRNSIQENNVALRQFVRQAYKQIYG